MQQQQQDWNEALVSRKTTIKHTISKNKYSRPEKQTPNRMKRLCLLKKKRKNTIRSPEDQSIDNIKNLGVNVEGMPQILYCI